ncbi:protein CMSS1 [Dendrobium catenatum]|uniref:Protein CMSS1 n=1 Tax=Dendrobium catenatum TaxID=906689 RepID=A0A2I0WM53_9ASPA|nr:protein CMSS1 [Dendrobium catenatum]PKU76740.1 hypothetical protein MA16_Dca001346 [Dendrobium catenatum]
MEVDKPRAPKRKKLKDNHPLKPRSTINRNKSKKLNIKNPNFVPLGENKFFEDVRVKDKEGKRTTKKATEDSKVETVLLSSLPATQQLGFFLDRFQSANKSKLSPLELEEYKDACMVELSKDINQDANNLSKHIKDAFGESWQEVLCDGKLSEGTIEPGSPAVLIISVSALKSLELLRGLKVYTKKCRPAKLFAKHMKVEEQVELLRNRVNIASGTPSRIKKLVDMDALILSRLAVIVLDMRSDAKGYSLLTLPQVSAEFWDLYRVHFNERIIQGRTRICFYGSAELRNPKKAISDY